MIFSLKFEQKNTNANLKDGTKKIIKGMKINKVYPIGFGFKLTINIYLSIRLTLDTSCMYLKY